MIYMSSMDVLRDIAGAFRVQFLLLPAECTSAEASALDFQFRDQLYEQYDYRPFALRMMELVPQDDVISYKDEYGMHYLVFRGRDTESGHYIFIGPYVHHTFRNEEYERLIRRHSLPPEAMDALRWYFKRIPEIGDYLSWRHLISAILSRYLANPLLEIRSVTYDHPEVLKRKPSVALSAIAYSSVEARYAVEAAMLDAVRRGNFSEATYQQNLFMGFALDQRNPDPLRNAKNMIISVNTAFRKAIQQAAVHPLYIDGISGQFMKEIEETESIEQVHAIIPKMIRYYCLMVQTHSLEKYSAPIRECINYIDFHYMEPLSLESLSLRLSVNKNYLSGRFHREVGKTITDYINQVRIQRSLELLSKTTLPMQSVAEQCGFTDANYFSRIFRKLHGTTPNDYRKSLQPGQTQNKGGNKA